MGQWVYLPVIVGAAVLFILPSVIAVIRGTDPLWIVVLLNAIPPLFLGAWLAVFLLPRPRPARARPAPLAQANPGHPFEVVPVADDPRCLFGGVPPAGPADASWRHDDTRAGASAWS